MFFRQGTWEFMAAELVAGTAVHQTFAHDLESFFWLLFWIALKYIEVEMGKENLSPFMKWLFTPDVVKKPGQGVTGGYAKKMFLTHPLALKEFQISRNPTLTKLVKKLKETVASRLLPDRSEDQSHWMDDHSKMLESFEEHLCKDWPERDGAIVQNHALSIQDTLSFQSGTKRSRSTFHSDLSEPSSSKSIKLNHPKN
jgi:hypothetical protein